jgi:peptidyl-prolyl cis-trans isomerase A (cyclophilin A)
MRCLLIVFALIGVVSAQEVSLDASRAQDRYEAARRLGEQGAEARDRVEPLLALLDDEESWVAAEAARALVRIGAEEEHVPVLVRFLERTGPDVAPLVGEVLAGIGRPATAPLLKRLKKSDEPRLRVLLITTLGLLGRHADAAAPVLVDLVTDANPGVARRAGEALRRIGPWAVDYVPDLVDRLRFAQEPRIRLAAAQTLGRIGPGAAAAIPHLREARAEAKGALQQAAVEALRRIDVLRPDEPAHEDLRRPHLVKHKAPKTFRVRFETTKGKAIVEFNREWAPHGVDRVYGLLKVGYFRDLAFFRVMEGFVAQFGIHGEAKVSTAWQEASIPDDPPKQPNVKGTITFAHAGVGTRTTQLFVNLGDNRDLDRQGFAPVGRVVEGLEVLASLYAAYGDGPPRGTGPDQDRIQYEGNRYLAREFPLLDYLERAVLLEPQDKEK